MEKRRRESIPKRIHGNNRFGHFYATIESDASNDAKPRRIDPNYTTIQSTNNSSLLLIRFRHFHDSNSGYLGASGCMILSSWGSAWGTWRAGLGVCHMGIDHPKGIIKNIVPIVMAGVLGIYGLIVSVIITQSISSPGGDGYNTYSIFNGYVHVSI